MVVSAEAACSEFVEPVVSAGAIGVVGGTVTVSAGGSVAPVEEGVASGVEVEVSIGGGVVAGVDVLVFIGEGVASGVEVPVLAGGGVVPPPVIGADAPFAS